MGKPLLYSVENGVALLTLNRPGRKNAINQEMLVELYNSLGKVENDASIHAAIITGAGTSFCSGIDLKAIKEEDLFDPRGDGTDMPDAFNACTKPVIGAVNGHAITGGFEIALNCDFLIAGESASFADTHVKVGIHPGWGMSQLLQQAVGQRMAKQWSLTGEFISARRAFEAGLVNEVLGDDILIERAREIAGAIGNNNLPMVMTVKKLIEYKNSHDMNNSLEHERDGFRKFIEAVFKK